MTHPTIHITPLSDKGAKLYQWAGWLVFGICMLHIVFWSVVTWHSWGHWATGALWRNENPATLHDLDINFGFWALPGSFTAPLILLSLLIVRAAKQRIKLPDYLGWGLLAWIIACTLLMLPSGFGLGIVPAVLLIAANRKR